MGNNFVNVVRDKKKSSVQSAQQTHTAMPPGWRRVWVQRKEGKTAGRYDAYVFRCVILLEFFVEVVFHVFFLTFIVSVSFMLT